MKDRVPLYPGRVRLTPVSGQENTYDMVRADDPTQEGTPLSKSTFLKDRTAALLGLGEDAVPDDVFASIANFANWYVWEKCRETIQYNFSRNNTDGGSRFPIKTYKYIYYSDTFTVVDGNKIALVDPKVLHWEDSPNPSDLLVLQGKYWDFGKSESIPVNCGTDAEYAYPDCIFLVNSSNLLVTSHNDYIYGFDDTKYNTILEKVSYVITPTDSPPVEEGYTFKALGHLGINVQIATGTYFGTGTYGVSNQNSLTFDFEPKVLLIASPNSSSSADFIRRDFAVMNQTAGMSTGGGTVGASRSAYLIFSYVSGNTISWYSTSAEYQENISGCAYNYVAIG